MSKQHAYLFVLSELGERVTLDEYHGARTTRDTPSDLPETGTTTNTSHCGSNSAHRLRRSATQSRSLPEFLTGIRYEATDGKKPQWSAAYEISDPLLFEQAKYTKLRANRSQREADLVGRLETLDRRTYTSVLYDSAGNEPPRGADDASPIVVTITSDDQPVDLEKWNDLSGWRRTTAYKLGDSLKISHGKAPETTGVARYLTVVEFDHPRDFEHSEQYRHAKEHAKEVRTWKVHRAFDNTATR